MPVKPARVDGGSCLAPASDLGKALLVQGRLQDVMGVCFQMLQGRLGPEFGVHVAGRGGILLPPFACCEIHASGMAQSEVQESRYELGPPCMGI